MTERWSTRSKTRRNTRPDPDSSGSDLRGPAFEWQVTLLIHIRSRCYISFLRTRGHFQSQLSQYNLDYLKIDRERQSSRKMPGSGRSAGDRVSRTGDTSQENSRYNTVRMAALATYVLPPARCSSQGEDRPC